MTIQKTSPTKTAIAAVLVLLATMGIGCVRQAAPVTWEASGVRVAELDLPLAGDVHRFSVSEYVLEGQESSGKNARRFRDRALVTADVLGEYGQLFGYVNRTYVGGGTLAFRLYGRIEPKAGDPDEALVVGRVFAVGRDGGIQNRLVSLDRVEIRLDHARGKISARGF